jgi:homoserine kinase type II
MAQYSKLQENEILEITKKYELNVIDYEPFEGSAENTSYWLRTLQGEFVLTIFKAEPTRVAHMSKVLLVLEAHDFPCPRIRKLANGDVMTDYEGKSVLLKPFISGQVIKELDENMIFQLGTAMARLHEIPVPGYLLKKHIYEVTTYPKVLEIGNNLKYTNWLRQRFDFLIRSRPSGLPSGLVHGDLFYDNLLFDGKKFKAIIDFVEVCLHYKVFDLGMAVVGSCTAGTSIVLNKVKALVRGYQDVRTLEKKEKSSLLMFIEYAAILTSTWRFWQYKIDEPDVDKSDRYLQMVKIAKGVRSIPQSSFMQEIFGG